MEERMRSHYESLARAIDFTKAADAKAAPVVILHVALIGALGFRAAPLFGALTPFWWTGWQISLIATILLYLFSSLGAIGVAGWVFLPKTPRTGKSLIYFQDIAAMCQHCFQCHSKELNADTIEEQLLEQIFVVSKIASQKMRRVKWALTSSGVAIALWIVLLAWGIIVNSTAQ